MPANKITRRSFIAGSSAVLAAYVAAACTPTAAPEPTAAPAATTAPSGASPEPVTGCPPQPEGPVLTDLPADAGEREVQQIVYNTPLDYGAATGGQITQFCESPVWTEMVNMNLKK